MRGPNRADEPGDGVALAEPPAPERPRTGSELGELVARARTGDEQAWRALVERMRGVVWKTVRSFGLGDADVCDAFASTFARMSEKLADVRDPGKLAGWLATTARNEVYAILRARRRLVPTSEPPSAPWVFCELEEGLLDDELRRAAAAALRGLRAQDQALMLLLTADPPLSYDEISELLGMPRGSIGPTRQRCLAQLRRSPELLPYMDGGTA